MTAHTRPWVIAHRGVLHEAPENTLTGFEWAIRQGADWIELDVHRTADQCLVVIHDETVDRTTNGVGTVASKTLQDLQALDAGSWMGSGFQGERIPTLADVLALTQGRVGVVIEVKAGSRQYPGIEQQIVSLLREAQRLNNTLIISADQDAVAAIRQLDYEIATLCFHEKLLVPETWAFPSRQAGDDFRCTRFLFGDVSEIDERAVAQAHCEGFGVLASLVPEKVVSGEMAAHLAQADVDGIFTNEPAALRELLDG